MTNIETNPYGAIQHTAYGDTTDSKSKKVNLNLDKNKEEERTY